MQGHNLRNAEKIREFAPWSKEKYLLEALASHSNPDGTEIWISNTKLAAQLHCSRRTIVRKLKKLHSRGEITYKRMGSGYRTNLITIPLLLIPDYVLVDRKGEFAT